MLTVEIGHLPQSPEPGARRQPLPFGVWDRNKAKFLKFYLSPHPQH